MIAAKFDLQIDAGTDFAQSFELTDPMTGAPIDITGYTAQAQIRITYADKDPLLTFTCAIGNTNGTITISLAKTLTANLPFSRPPNQCDQPIKGVWDLLLTDTGPKTTRLVRGDVCIFPQVTR